jgi:DNA polymerase-1
LDALGLAIGDWRLAIGDWRLPALRHGLRRGERPSLLNRKKFAVTACGFQNAKAPGFEADDFLAAAGAKEEKHGGTAFIASGDRDTFQLASDRITILYPVRAGEMARVGPAEVRARYGVDPKQVPDFIALRGDPSDKVPGASGVGATGAATLLQRAAAKIWQLGSCACSWPLPRNGGQPEALSLYRNDEQASYTAEPSQSDANLAQGRQHLPANGS